MKRETQAPTWTVEDAVEAIAKDGLPPHLNTLEERIEYGLALERLPRRGGVPRAGVTEIIGPVVLNSYSQYKRAKAVVLAAKSTLRPPEVINTARKAVDEVEAGTITVSAAYERLRAAEKAAAPNDWTEFDRGGLPKTPPPAPNARTPKARAVRIEWTKALAAQGATSYEIAEKLGIGRPAVAKLSRDFNIIIPADKALNRTPRRIHDPNRVVSVAAEDLAALVWSLERINPDDLDPAQASVWGAQLHDHALTINRMARRISPKKENQ